MADVSLLDPFSAFTIPLGEWADNVLKWTVANFRDFFQTIKYPVAIVLSDIEGGLRAIPPLLGLGLFSLVGWQLGGARTGWATLLCFSLIGFFGVWAEAMTTLAIVLTSVFFCAMIGIPLGVATSRFDRFEAGLRPVLDFMQTIPSFVYLVPIVMLFGIGNVSGVIVTIIYAMPPVVRLTNLGIRQVRADLIEAAHAFGASPRQTLFKVQIPLAGPTIMAGVNQTIMMSLSMAVVASMIAVTGLGQMVLRGIGRLDMGLATVGGVGIVLLAIAVDRTSQGIGLTSREWEHRRWYQRGPIGLVTRCAVHLLSARSPLGGVVRPKPIDRVAK
jgi:glycine betaine/proline transport system permease protein